MQEFEATRSEKQLQSDNESTTTLIIENIPSELAYNIVIGNYSKGHFLSKEEIIQEYEKVADPEKYLRDKLEKENQNFQIRIQMSANSEEPTIHLLEESERYYAEKRTEYADKDSHTHNLVIDYQEYTDNIIRAAIEGIKNRGEEIEDTSTPQEPIPTQDEEWHSRKMR